MVHRMRSALLATLPLVLGSCVGFYGVARAPEEDADQEVDADADGDIDGDGDADGDADADGDTDVDADGDTDGDTDGDGDSDSDGDGEVDADPDGDVDEDIAFMDTDGDGISDHDEEADAAVDTDGDGIADYRDLDSDGDGVRDQDEAGDNDPRTLPVDTDDDGTPDFRDLDSDDDWLSDRYEQTASETSRVHADTDGDGASDLVEVLLLTNPRNAVDNPAASGIAYFLVPSGGRPTPDHATLELPTDIEYADFYFLIEQSGSTFDEITLLQDAAEDTTGAARRYVSDPRLGVGGFSDYPVLPYGSDPIPGAYRNVEHVSAEDDVLGRGFGELTMTSGGGDEPNSAVPALHAVATGCGDGDGAGAIPDDPGRACVLASVLGYPHFRNYAMPVVLLITNTPFHNGPAGAHRYGTISGVTPPRYAGTVTALTAIHARVVGLNIGSNATVTDHLEALAVDTGTVSRDLAGGLEPLVYDVNTADPTDLSRQVHAAIEDVVTLVPMDVTAMVVDTDGGEVDAVEEFVNYIETSRVPGCEEGLGTRDEYVDGHDDTYVDVVPGSTVCYDLVPRTNEVSASGEPPAVFSVIVSLWGDLVTQLDERRVYFIATWDTPL